MATSGAGPRSRAEQLARTNQVGCGKFGRFVATRSTAERLAGGCAERIERDRLASGIAQPLHASLCTLGAAASAAKGTDERRGGGDASGEYGNASAGTIAERTGDFGSGRRGANRASANKSITQCGGSFARDWRRSKHRLEGNWRLRGDHRAGRGPGDHESDESFCALFHDQTRWLGNWSRTIASDCRSAWGIPDAFESEWRARGGSGISFA